MSFPEIRFKGKLRPSQKEVVDLIDRQGSAERRRIHVVAPPGTGKTVLGLYLWAEYAKCPAVVLSPNSAIQAQWAARTELFEISPSGNGSISTDCNRPGILTSLTYQAVTLPRRGGEDLNEAAVTRWIEKLILDGQAEDPGEALFWIEDLQRHNREYYEDRLRVYRKEIRDDVALQGDALHLLHESSLETLKRLRDHHVGLIILDECHHLLGHWGRVLADAYEFLSEPMIVGLTATPPDISGKAEKDVSRYREFFGPVDYEVPLPAVVKDGFLAPYQDLAYFVRPTSEEVAFVANVDARLRDLIEELCASDACEEPLIDWLSRVLRERQLPTGSAEDWASFENRDPEFAATARLFLFSRNVPLPPEVSQVESEFLTQVAHEFDTCIPVLDRYVRHRLRRSKNSADHELAEKVIRQLRLLGVQITETGSQPCASPVSRIMGYSHSKSEALIPILCAENAVLGEKIRAVVVCDYEKTSAVNVDHGTLPKGDYEVPCWNEGSSRGGLGCE